MPEQKPDEAQPETSPALHAEAEDLVVAALSIGWDAVEAFITERAINGIPATERLANATRIAAVLLKGE